MNTSVNIVHFITTWCKCVPINHKIDYTVIKATVSIPCCMKQSWDTQTILMKWLKISKVSFSLSSCCWRARPLSPTSSMLLLWKVGQHVGNRRRPPHKITDSFAGLTRPTRFSSVTKLSQLSKSGGVVFWGEKSLLQIGGYFSSSPGDGLLLPQICNKTPA